MESQMGGAAAAGMGIGMIIFLILILALFMWPLWKIFEKTGRSGATALLMLVPLVGPIIVMYMLAFGRWPRFERA
jgi:carbon starvation protein CstA